MLQKILLIIFLIVGLIITVYLVGQRTGFLSRADLSTTPQDIRVSNIADNAFTISWITAKSTIGFIQYGESESLGNTVNDDRDTNGPKSHFTHHITLKNLNPATTYFYNINGIKLVKQTTAPTTNDTPPLADPIFGKVVKSDQTIPSESIIYSQIGDSTLLSTYSRDDGNFLLTLNNARTKDLLNYLTIKDNDQVNFIIKIPEGSMEKQVSASSRNLAVNIVLDSNLIKKTSSSWMQDYNQDGVINVFDFAIFLKE